MVFVPTFVPPNLPTDADDFTQRDAGVHARWHNDADHAINRLLPTGHDWLPYATNEGFPVVDGEEGTPTLDFEQGMYKVTNGICYFWAIAGWGGSAGAGRYLIAAPPPPPLYGPLHASGSGSMFVTCSSGADFGVRNGTFPVAFVDNIVSVSPGGIPDGRRLFTFVSPTNSYSPPGGTATVLAGQSTKVVTHGLALAPDSVHITPLAEPRLSARDSDPVRYWVTDITDTTFTLHAETEGSGDHFGSATVALNASTAVVTHNFAVAPSAVLITPKGSPAASGADAAHIWVSAIGGTTFTINAQTAAGAVLTGSLAFSWRAMRGGFEPGATLDTNMPFSWHVFGPTLGEDLAGIYMTAKYPWPWVSGSRIDMYGWYPIDESA